MSAAVSYRVYCRPPQAVLREKLLYATHFCRSMDTDDYAHVAMAAQPAAEDDPTT